MKRTRKFLAILVFLALAASPAFAAIEGFDDTLGLNGSDSPMAKVINLVKVIAVVFLVGWIIISAIRYLKADGGQKSEIIKSTIIGVVAAATLILVAFKVPKFLGLTGVSADGAVIRIENTEPHEDASML